MGHEDRVAARRWSIWSIFSGRFLPPAFRTPPHDFSITLLSPVEKTICAHGVSWRISEAPGVCLFLLTVPEEPSSALLRLILPKAYTILRDSGREPVPPLDASIPLSSCFFYFLMPRLLRFCICFGWTCFTDAAVRPFVLLFPDFCFSSDLSECFAT